MGPEGLALLGLVLGLMSLGTILVERASSSWEKQHSDIQVSDRARRALFVTVRVLLLAGAAALLIVAIARWVG